MSATGEPVGDSTVSGMASPSSPATEGASDKVVFVVVIYMRISNSLLFQCTSCVDTRCNIFAKIIQNYKTGK